jgi:hypothetical protein
VLSCIGKGYSANCGLPDVLQTLPVQHRKEKIEKSYATRREKVEMALGRSAILDFFFFCCNIWTYLLVILKWENFSTPYFSSGPFNFGSPSKQPAQFSVCRLLARSPRKKKRRAPSPRKKKNGTARDQSLCHSRQLDFCSGNLFPEMFQLQVGDNLKDR